MTRQIIRRPAGAPLTVAAPAGTPTPDQYKDRLLKYIPADVVAIYLTLMGIIAGAQPGTLKTILPWAVFVVIAIITPFYIKFVGKVTDTKQIVVGSVAFLIWAITLGAPFDQAHISWYNPIIGALLLPFFTFLIPLTD
jgi:hypothetical protein